MLRCVCTDFAFDIGEFGAPTTLTPNLDRMINEGMKFTTWLSGANICSPSRASLLTGRLPIRTGVFGKAPNEESNRVVHPDCYGGLRQGELTLPAALKKQGYSSAMVGKWHLGYAYGKTDLLPLARGFDRWHGTPATHCESGGSSPPEAVFMDNTKIGRLGIDIPHGGIGGCNLTHMYVDFATTFIRNESSSSSSTVSSVGGTGSHEEQPWLLYTAFDNTHDSVYTGPMFPPGVSARGPFGDATMELDWAVGQLLDTIRSQPSAATDTLAFFAGDNGAWMKMSPLEGSSEGPYGGEWAKNPEFAQSNGGSNYLDTGKGSTWEGGFRVPGIAWWPGTIAPRSTQIELASTIDIFPTALSLAGVSTAGLPVLDGKDITALLMQKPQPPSAAGGRRLSSVRTPHTCFFYYSRCAAPQRSPFR
jgi:arylsulfatase A-like enzyme